MSTKTTKLIFLIDRSGSMERLQNDSINGYNSFIENQKNEKCKTLLTTVFFDNEYTLFHNNINIKEVKKLKIEDCYAKGCTALFDAIGKTINTEVYNMSKLDGNKKPDKIVFVIITDGEENSSKEYSLQNVKDLITKQTKNGWEFIYLGANVDSFANAVSMNIGTFSNYSFTSQGVESTYSTLSRAVNTDSVINNNDLKGIV